MEFCPNCIDALGKPLEMTKVLSTGVSNRYRCSRCRNVRDEFFGVSVDKSGDQVNKDLGDAIKSIINLFQ